MFDPHSLSRTSPPDQPFDLETIEAMSRAYQAACWKLDLADRDDVAQHVIELAQTGVRNPTALYRLTVKEFQKRSGECLEAAFVGSAKVQICRCDRRNSDRHGGVVLGFNAHLESSVCGRLIL
jgi:hypothetical protein